MNRKEVMLLLNELITHDIVNPSFVSIEKIMPDNFQLQIMSNYRKIELEKYAKKNSLSIEEDKEKKYLVIFKP